MSDDTSNVNSVIRGMFNEIVSNEAEIESLRESSKAIFSTLKAEHQIDPKIARTVVRMLRKGDADKVRDDYMTSQRLYDAVS